MSEGIDTDLERKPPRGKSKLFWRKGVSQRQEDKGRALETISCEGKEEEPTEELGNEQPELWKKQYSGEPGDNGE